LRSSELHITFGAMEAISRLKNEMK